MKTLNKHLVLFLQSVGKGFVQLTVEVLPGIKADLGVDQIAQLGRINGIAVAVHPGHCNCSRTLR